MRKITKACDIPLRVRNEVLERDNFQCIICGSNQNLQMAHYVSRARLGLGIPKNLATMCVSCHFQMDNGKYHKELQQAVREYLQAHYSDWKEEDLTYKKWRF